MNFADFQQFREKILRERQDVRDCAATNLYAALARLIPPVAPTATQTVHRCHLAAEWAQCFGLPGTLARCAFVSCGIRDSLAILFRHYARMDARVWLPADNYPVYRELAAVAGLVTEEFVTLPEPIWPEAEPTSNTMELLVITNPLKPLARWLSTDDVAALKAWLALDPRRRLLLDTVYTFETRFHPTTLELVATQQTILLHSLTKGWLQPRLFGIALIPGSDFAALAPAFRAQSPPQSNLARAHELIAHHARMPVAISRELDLARVHPSSFIPQDFATIGNSDAPGYFTPVMGHWQDILDAQNVLGLPATVFGSRRADITILSNLSFLA